jgi:hypothetical protein
VLNEQGQRVASCRITHTPEGLENWAEAYYRRKRQEGKSQSMAVRA